MLHRQEKKNGTPLIHGKKKWYNRLVSQEKKNWAALLTRKKKIKLKISARAPPTMINGSPLIRRKDWKCDCLSKLIQAFMQSTIHSYKILTIRQDGPCYLAHFTKSKGCNEYPRWNTHQIREPKGLLYCVLNKTQYKGWVTESGGICPWPGMTL